MHGAHFPAVVLMAALLVAAPVAPALAQDYILGAPDVLKVTVWGQEDLSKEYVIDRDGTIDFPLLGRVLAAGRTARALAADLTTALAKDYLVNPQVNVIVREYLSKKVQILGEAEHPGIFYLSGPTRLVEILAKAGGVTKNAGTKILVVRNLEQRSETVESRILPVDLAKLQAGDMTGNVLLQEDDAILVPAAAAIAEAGMVFVFGAVKSPGGYPWKQNMSILEAVTLAGGFTHFAFPNKTRLIRQAAGVQETVLVRMEDLFKGGRTETPPKLKENDMIVVPDGRLF
jgi:polysaccharide export outer membrane protein